MNIKISYRLVFISYGLNFIIYETINYIIVFASLFQAHSKISEMFNETHFKCVVSDIITGAIKESHASFPFVQKLRERLERSSTEIFPFFEACSRRVQIHKIH